LSRGRAGESGAAAGGGAAGGMSPSQPPEAPSFEWDRAAEHCRIAYLRGRFLAHGSLSLASGRTHLEFVLPADEALLLCDQLAGFEMAANWRMRRGRGVVTWKSVETVVTFLKVVGGGSSLLELESRQVSRTVRGDLNRVINAESANLRRAVAASARQVEAIDAVEADGRLAEQPYVVLLVADARREEPEATFSQLADRLGLHRSAVQRALERIERLALHPDEGVGKRRPRKARARA
jgi:DNA-binding protein WhiA